MKPIRCFFLFCMLLIIFDFTNAQVVNKTVISPPRVITEKPDLKVIDTLSVDNIKVTVNTWSVGKISASQAVVSYSIRISDTTQPIEHGICFSTSTNPTVSNPRTVNKGYTTNTLYGELSGLKPAMKYYLKAYMRLLNYPDKIYYGNEISFTTLVVTGK